MAAVEATTILSPKGRGRGRGRGISTSTDKPGAEVKHEKSIRDYISTLDTGKIESTFDYVTRSYPKEQETQDEIVSEVCSRALKETDFAKTAALFLERLWLFGESSNFSIRKPLLSQIQKLYKTRNDLSDEAFQGYSALLCELFSTLKISDEPLKALISPVFNVLNELLSKAEKSLDSLLIFHVLLLKHGRLLDKENKAKMTDLINIIRSASLETRKKVHQCIFLEIIELYSCGWDMDDDVVLFYSDTLSELIEQEGNL